MKFTIRKKKDIRKMSTKNPNPIPTFFHLALLLLLVSVNMVSSSTLNSNISSDFDVVGSEEMELEMDSESNRRILAMQRSYISYETLKKDMVPCDTPGASYYNCRAGRVANHYSRGCEYITRCARDTNDIKT